MLIVELKVKESELSVRGSEVHHAVNLVKGLRTERGPRQTLNLKNSPS